MTPRGWFKDADGRLVECGFGPDGKTNGCTCTWVKPGDEFTKRKPDKPINIPGHWDSSGCPLHGEKVKR